MAKSSINFAKASEHSTAHNLREDEPSYLLPKEHRLKNEFWQHEKSEIDIFKESASKQKTGKKPQFKNSRWEAILNFNQNHSIEDIKKVVKHIEKKFNITCTSIAMHKDEGHINERGIVQYNLHAHLNFVTHKDGRQNWRRAFIQAKDLRELQTDVASIMGMERGVDKRTTGREHLTPNAFKAQAQELENIKATQQEAIFSAKAEAYELAYGYDYVLGGPVLFQDLLEIEQEKTARLERRIEELEVASYTKREEEKATLADLKKVIKEQRAELQAQQATRAEYAELEAENRRLKLRIENQDLTVTELENEADEFFTRQLEEQADDYIDRMQEPEFEAVKAENSLLKNRILELEEELGEENSNSHYFSP
jgi:hypothetical protein